MEDNVPSATLIFIRSSEHTEYEENNEDRIVMWLEAPELINQDWDWVKTWDCGGMGT